jgi:hypothetical protein
MGLNHGFTIVHLGLLNYGLGHELLDVGEAI